MERHVEINRDYWNAEAPGWVAAGERLWASEPQWGNWGVPEAELGLLPWDMTGMDAIELGCGTAYVSGWMARRGAKVTGIDVSARQLETARRLVGEHGADVTLIEGNAEATGLPDASFDFAISEYGAAIWCDPAVWLVEAARLLRPNGRLVFLGNHPLTMVCSPPSGAPFERVLHLPWRGIYSADWTEVEIDPAGIEFNRSFEGWFEVFADTGFRPTHYRELYAPDHATGHCGPVPADWAKDFPHEQVWWLERR